MKHHCGRSVAICARRAHLLAVVRKSPHAFLVAVKFVCYVKNGLFNQLKFTL